MSPAVTTVGSNKTAKEDDDMKSKITAAIFLGTALLASVASAAPKPGQDIQAPRLDNEDIQAPRLSDEDVQAPRGGNQDVQAPRGGNQDIQAPRGSNEDIQAPRG
jgi:hypothetical protein